MFAAKVVCDSVGPNGKRLISVEMTYPRFIHAEIMTHRDRERNAASSRAIPWRRTLMDAAHYEPGAIPIVDHGQWLHPKCMKYMIMVNPVIPIFFGKEQAGMQVADQELSPEDKKASIKDILDMRDFCVERVQRMADRGLHKSICNRYTEPWMWITTLMTSTEWKNFFRLRVHPDAEKHFQKIAGMTRDAIEASKPTPLNAGGWHMPYLRTGDTEDAELIADSNRHFALSEVCNSFRSHHDINRKAIVMKLLQRVSAARCARLSYLTHDGRKSVDEDLKLFHKLIVRTDDVLHASPLGHVAEASNDPEVQSGPFRGWRQLRKQFPNENVQG